jgi:hypothetical protein
VRRPDLTGMAPWRWLASGAVVAAAVALIVCRAVFPAFAHWGPGGASWYYVGLINGYLLCMATDRLLRRRQ